MLPRFRGRTRIAISVACLAVLAAARLSAMHPAWIERYYAERAGPLIARGLAAISGVWDQSVAEVLTLLLVVASVLLAVSGGVAARRGSRTWSGVIAGGALNVVTAGLLLSATFYLVWGLNYYRPALDERLGWRTRRESADLQAAARELHDLSRTLIERTNRARQALGARDWTLDDTAAIDTAIEGGYRRVARDLNMPAWAVERGRSKPLRISSWLCRLGIGGIYAPWTAEAGYNHLVPAWELPHTIAHEKAHQRGLAREDEANFVGFLATIRSDLPQVRYSGWLFAQGQLLRELYRLDPDDARALQAFCDEAVLQDMRASDEFWSRFRGPLRTAGKRLNDAYLELQGIEAGIESYALSSRLIVLWARGEDFQFDDERNGL